MIDSIVLRGNNFRATGVLANRGSTMLIKKASDIPSSEITDESWYLRRREFLRVTSGAVLGAAAAGIITGCGYGT